MSWKPGATPTCGASDIAPIELTIEGNEHDIGALTVKRILPSPARQMIGPFVFFDHIGPAVLGPGPGISVRPHPHINLATVTYLFEGAIEHRDSLGSNQTILPGAINWMTAGRGIVHSERTPAARQASGGPVHGIQLWLALPVEHEEVEPTFVHHPAETIPRTEVGGVGLRVLAGEAFGVRSPVVTLSPLLYVEAVMPAGSTLVVPTGQPERAAYVVTGEVSCDGNDYAAGTMLVLAAGREVALEASRATTLMLLGGEPLGKRILWWNFVASSKERLERAKLEWSRGPGATESFPLVPGDVDEFIPLPD